MHYQCNLNYTALKLKYRKSYDKSFKIIKKKINYNSNRESNVNLMASEIEIDIVS